MLKCFPHNQVLVLTDSAGSLPVSIPKSFLVRTSALKIVLENYSEEQREEILVVAEEFAGKVVEVRSFDDLEEGARLRRHIYQVVIVAVH